VKSETQFRYKSVGQDSPRSAVLARAAVIFLLLIAVSALSTLAKDGQYFPRTNPARHASLSTKMKVAQPPVIFSGDVLQLVARIAPPPPTFQVTRLEKFEITPIRSISITVSMQHRSPPLSLA
jgi:hypothetical protein